MKTSKNLLFMLFVAIGLTSCGSFQPVVTTGYYSGTDCINAEYAYGVQGFGLYDCYGRLIHRGSYNFNNGYWNNYYYGPRIIIRSGGNNRSTTNVATPRGSRGTVTTPRSKPRGGRKSEQ